jgi:HprK-related kinase A
MFASLRPNASLHGPCLRRATVGIGGFSIAISLEVARPDLEQQIEHIYGGYPRHDPKTLPDVTITLRHQNLRLMLFRPAIRVFANDEAPYQAVPDRWALPVVEATINWFVWSYVARVLLLHAAVVEREGRAVILSGPTGAGKSTLCAALIARGFRFLTDEIALVRPNDGQLQPHPRPISLKNEAIDIVATMLPDARLSARFANASKGTVAFMRPPKQSIEAAGETARPALVIFPTYRPEAGFELKSIERSQAFMRLIESSANYLTLLETGFETLANLVEAGDHYALDYASLDDAVGAIESLARVSRGIPKVA